MSASRHPAHDSPQPNRHSPRNSFLCHTSKISPVSPFLATDPKTTSRNSFICHTSDTPPASQSSLERLNANDFLFFRRWPLSTGRHLYFSTTYKLPNPLSKLRHTPLFSTTSNSRRLQPLCFDNYATVPGVGGYARAQLQPLLCVASSVLRVPRGGARRFFRLF